MELEFGSVGFVWEGKLDCPERILSEQGREPRTNSAHIQRLHLDSNLSQKDYCEKYHNILKIVVSIWEYYVFFAVVYSWEASALTTC